MTDKAAQHGHAMVVGLTGGIGSGKTSVARLLAHYHISIIDADIIARQVTDSDEAVREALRCNFGPELFDDRGRLRRERLGDMVFADERARSRLNSIVHPRILEITREQIRRLAAGGAPLIIVDAALIYEIGIEHTFSKIVVVYAPLEQRLARLRTRNGLHTDSILQRISAQLPLEEKVNKADYVIYNTSTLMALRRQVRALYAWLESRLIDMPRRAKR